MEQELRDELADSRGFLALAVLWVRLLVDLAMSIPVQITRELFQDLKYTFRLWRTRPLPIVFAIAALAIGIGATTGVFSVVNSLLLRSLPFRNPDRLALLQHFFPPVRTAKEFHDWEKHSEYLADAAVFEEGDVNLGGPTALERAHIAETSWNFFSTLGVQPFLGRGFVPGEDTAGHNNVAVIAYGLWQELFAGNAHALGSTLMVDGQPVTIVGVAPARFDYPGKSVLWRPGTFSSGNFGWITIGRLKQAISWQQARSAFSTEAARWLAKTGPRARFIAKPRMMSLRDGLLGPVRNASLLLLGAVLLVLLIACTNVANLFIARTADRAGELSIRSALGASRSRLARQMLTECLFLSFVAALAGLLVAYWTTSLAARVQPPPLDTQSYSIVDGRVLAFAVLVTIVTALLSGILPSLHTRRVQAFGARASNGTRGSRLVRESLSGAQVMLTIILLAASVSVGRAFVHLMGIDRGYDAKGIVTASVSLEGTDYQQGKRQLPYFEEVLGRIRKLPGIRAASATEFLPLDAAGFVGGPFGLNGRPAARNSMMVPVLSEYFRAMGGQVLYGREFTAAEVRTGAKVAVVSEGFASLFGPPAEAVGRQLTIGRTDHWEIVGVAKGMDYEEDPTVAGEPEVFVPATAPAGFYSTFVVRVDGRAEDYLAAVRYAIRSVDPEVPIFGLKTMQQRLDAEVARPKFYRTAIWAFAAFALLLTMIGIYGIFAYAVVQRTKEIGVRIALGATPAGLRGMLIRRGLLMVGAGAIPGIAGALVAERFVESLMEGARPIGMATFASLILFLALVASMSIWSATRRIARLDIITILRFE
ncbi:MAG: ABC transporter permease [Acidobacteriota bacterium]|nr:ABC transporter permease [Acidobacteriota bacterium]